jgi:hypothetical protein
MLNYSDTDIRERRRREFVARIPIRGKARRVLMASVKTNINQMRWTPDAEWTRKYIALALSGCSKCFGTGTRLGGEAHLCQCVTRAIFRALRRKYHWIASGMEGVSSCVPTIVRNGVDASFTWSMRKEEFSADFYLLAKRCLDARHFRIFQLHVMEGRDWRDCCNRLKIDRGTFFHAVNRLEHVVGLAAVQLKPYALYPIDEYLGQAQCGSGPFKQKGVNNLKW